ncbi:hypothetical protein Ais01nite_00240 [Asanoa ishikariensis]|uniref:Uncharacterized protein n=1 Tax=Asanoa ishikariensis TaxID=137265 RepID=A0A1H3TRV4_9ACTN|nr:hypothetical protein [Asanoa ishikariensis]GIF61989.1 hypothetical protein Ais01nite_00240 [Asanoa ishikariensis]SDZ52415.1 hypothetical protein SAMN05421684_6199 [Asanoa ishikariensis]
MISLPRGATGFWDAAAGSPKSTDVLAFRTVVHAAVLEVGGKVEGFEAAGVTPNFHLLMVRTGDDRVGVVCHELLPWLALVQPPDGSLTFRSEPRLAGALHLSAPWRLLDRKTLGTRVNRLDLSTLDRGERDQIAFWQPATLGELLFNWWD